ncbi:hypothetical protein [Streptomyces sp. NPDC052721]|uniref:hypothetical protein n=1 Tax=Streptomyces sp. NPDC052721 TaxID=3154955 RepID=UPI003433EB55
MRVEKAQMQGGVAVVRLAHSVEVDAVQPGQLAGLVTPVPHCVLYRAARAVRAAEAP